MPSLRDRAAGDGDDGLKKQHTAYDNAHKHDRDDTDTSADAHHHTLGIGPNQAASGRALKELQDKFSFFFGDGTDPDASLYYTKAESDAKYSLTTHNHTGTYSPAGHTHSGTYEPPIATGNTDQYWRGDKSWQVLNDSHTHDTRYYTETETEDLLDLKEPLIVAAGGLFPEAYYWRGDKTWQTIASLSSGHTHSYEPVISAGTTSQYWRGDKSWQTLNDSHTHDTRYYTESETSTLLAAKEASITAGNTDQYWRGDKTWQVLNDSHTHDTRYYTESETITLLDAREPLIVGPGGLFPDAYYWRGDKTWQTLASLSSSHSHTPSAVALLLDATSSTNANTALTTGGGWTAESGSAVSGSFTAPTSGKVKITIGAFINTNTTNMRLDWGLAWSGGNTRNPLDKEILTIYSGAGASSMAASKTFTVTGLTSGVSYTLTSRARCQVANGTVGVSERMILVEALG